MSTSSQRMVSQVSSLRLTPPEPLPDSFTKRFPELKDWDARNLEIWKRNVEETGRYIASAIALAKLSPTP